MIQLSFGTVTDFNIDTRWHGAAIERGRGVFRPVTHREWLAIERKWQRKPKARKPVGFAGAPPPVLEDGRTVAEALDARKAR